MRATRKRRAYPAQTRFARLNAALAFGLERGGRAALLAGASTIAFAAFGSAAVWAACSNGNQTISSATTGPVLGDWDGSTPGAGNITVDSGVGVAGSPQGVFAESCGIDTLQNMGSISGQNSAGGAAVQASAGVTIHSLTNATGATISGGSGRNGIVGGGTGGAGVSNGGTISSLTNNGTVEGGAGGGVEFEGVVGGGGAGIDNSGTIASLTNSYAIAGGALGDGVSNGGTISLFTNSGTVQGGAGVGGIAGEGAAGIANSGMISSLINSGAIAGGAGLSPRAGGAGIDNSGTIASLTNSGVIAGGAGSGGVPGRAGEGLVNETTGIIGVLDNRATGTIDVIDNKGVIGGGGASQVGLTNAGKIGTLTNSGTLKGGAGGAGQTHGGLGGAGVANSNTISTLTNSGMVYGGAGGVGSGASGVGGAGGAGILNSDMISTALTNSGAVQGGAAGLAAGGNARVLGDTAGTGIANSGTISALTNNGTVKGGAGGYGDDFGGNGGLGIANSGTIASLTNMKTVQGGMGGAANTTANGLGGNGGVGVQNSGTITSLTNSGTIAGGDGGGAHGGGTGGTGISNSGTITSLTNSGTIAGGDGGHGLTAAGDGAPGKAISSASGQGGVPVSIGSITNSGQIIGNVDIEDQANLNVYGGKGTTFGSWSGGTITIGAGNLTFAGGNTALADNIEVYGGSGTVFNDDPLMVAAPETITGNFDQSSNGVLELDFAGDVPGEYGALTVTQLATLSGDLAIELTGGFTLTTGETFNVLTYGDLAGDFTGVSIDGVPCTASANSWTCSDGVVVTISDPPGSLDFYVEHGQVLSTPEPSTWAMLLSGFLGLGALALRRRKSAGAAQRVAPEAPCAASLHLARDGRPSASRSNSPTERSAP
jgi:hypothetical protein